MSLPLILDYYVDEPACFGVPPFISPYVRYTYGAFRYNQIECAYLSVDELREYQFSLTEFMAQTGESFEIVFLIAGATVPGKYLGGKIGSLSEIYYFAEKNPDTPIVLGGPIKFASKVIREELDRYKNIYLCLGEIELLAFEYAKDVSTKSGRRGVEYALGSLDFSFRAKKNYELISKFAVYGSEVITKHFRFPYVIIELETYQGCTRDVYCSFCTEAFYGRPVFRPLEDIFEEVEALSEHGARYFRLGRQADIYTYMADMTDFKNTFPRPKPQILKKLYTGIHKHAPHLKVLHLDNVNPGLIATFPKEAEQITETISEHNTVMDTAAMGMESADTQVIKENDLKASPEEVESAVKIIHKYGSKRENGLPKLSAGLNFISGLPGENKKTFELNYVFLKSLVEQGIFLRRINLRQVWTFERTKLAHIQKNKRLYKKQFIREKFLFYKEKIRDEIDKPMLKMAFPRGTVIPNVILEKKVPDGYLGRAMGSYPITCHIWSFSDKIKNAFQKKGWQSTDVVIVGYKERTLYCLCLHEDWSFLPLATWRKFLPKEAAYSLWEGRGVSSVSGLPAYIKEQISKNRKENKAVAAIE